MELSIRIEDQAAPHLARVVRRLPDALAQGTEDATILVLREIVIYPGQRAPRNGRVPYRRTGTLGRSWFRRVRRSSTGATGEIVSSGQIAPYNVYVQHSALQASIHRGVWQTERQVVERLRPQIVAIYQRRAGLVVTVG